jgi:hypothetical protein
MGGGLGEPGRRTVAAGAGLVAGQPPGHDHDGGPVDTSCAKKDTGPASRQIDQIVLLLGAADVAASKRFYVDRGLAVAKSLGRKYVEFATLSSPAKLALYGRRALARDAGVSPDGTGSHRLMIGSDAGPFTDPDGFAWEAASRRDVRSCV